MGQHVEQTLAPQGWSKYLLYLIAGIIPLVGLVLGIIYLLKPDKPCKIFGVICLILGICFWPIGILLITLGMGIFFAGGSSVAPFIYSLF